MSLKLEDAITGSDNSMELILVAALTALAAGLFFTYWDVVKMSHAFDWDKFGEGVGWLLGGTGLGYGGKKWGDSRPNGSPGIDTTITTDSTTATVTAVSNTPVPITVEQAG